eukprot:2117232-Rhodomonas_salina.2
MHRPHRTPGTRVSHNCEAPRVPGYRKALTLVPGYLPCNLNGRPKPLKKTLAVKACRRFRVNLRDFHVASEPLPAEARR